MTRRATIVLPHPSIDAAEWATLLALRSDDGLVDPNTVAHVFRNVELNPEMIRHIESVLLEAKISIAKIEPDISGEIEIPAPRPLKLVPPKVATPRVLAGDAGDAVRMYLGEIGQVALLSADDEKRLGRAIRTMRLNTSLLQTCVSSFLLPASTTAANYNFLTLFKKATLASCVPQKSTTGKRVSSSLHMPPGGFVNQ